MSLGLLQWATRMSSGQLIQQWLAHIRHILMPRTVAHYSMVLWRFNGFMPPDPRNLTVEHIEAYLESILQRYTKRTANAHLTAIKSFCKWASEHYDTKNPAGKIKMLREDPPRQRILAPDEYQKVLSVCSEHEADVICFLGNTALRASEFQNLKANNVSPCGQFLTFTGKGNRRRVVPLNKTCRRILKLNTILNLTKSFSTRNALYALCKRLSVSAGIPTFGPHAIRHYAITKMLKYVPLHFVSRIAGHADTRTTEKIYWHIKAEQDLLGVTDVLD